MLFPSIVFLFCFFPAMLFMYYGVCGLIIPEKHRIKAKNLILLAGSLVFYGYGEGLMVLLLVISIFFNWLFGMLIGNTGHKKLFLISSLVFNIGIFFVFKYLDFFTANINAVFHTSIPMTGLTIPLGISFFTFQALSYVIDVNRDKVAVQKNPLNLGLYISLFPQLIAGPIVRYETVEDEILHRKETIDDFSSGIRRFIIGMAKKVILADTLIIFSDKAVNALNGSGLSVSFAWLGIICYTLHIYFDFSGYSDMAIGLGRMFGFHFNENFNYPYMSLGITEFWRRWHISLGSWFRDYVYIPLGGSKKGNGRYILNALTVWLITGLWHGAAWTFVIWGLMQYLILIAEKYVIKPAKRKSLIFKCFYHVVTIVLICLCWVMFNASSVTEGFSYMGAMFGIGAAGLTDAVSAFLFKDNIIMITAGLICATPLLSKAKKYKTAADIVLILLFMICIVYILRGGFSPFIYFNF